MKFIKKTIVALAMLATTCSFAQTATNYALNLTVVNNTDTSLTYTGVTEANPGNVFTVPAVIPAHSQGLIVGEITKDFDLGGFLHFQDQSGNDNVFFVLDPRQFHMQQPAFELGKGYITATVLAKTFNPHIAARDLLLTEAKVSFDKR